MRERRKTTRNFSVEVDKGKFDRFEEKLLKKEKTKTQWLNEKIAEELEMDLNWEIECPYCGEKVDVDLENYVVDESGYERQMGTETEYTIECGGVKCQNCNKYFGIRGSIWEYSEGVYNYDSLETIKEGEEEEENYDYGSAERCLKALLQK